MSADFSQIQELLQQRADCQARLNLMPYDGNPEVKEVNCRITEYLSKSERRSGMKKEEVGYGGNGRNCRG